MRRHRIRPYGTALRPTRALTMVMAVAILFMLYQRMRDPVTWQILLDAKPPETKEEAQAPPAKNAPKPVTEEIVPGPNDQDEEEFTRVKEAMFELVTDKTKLKPPEMHLYWQLMSWARTQSFADLQERAWTDVPFTQLWEQPEKNRGKLISLRLHVRRVLEWEDKSNPLKLAKVYEAWGWTDESRSYPYCVVFPDLPADLELGTDMRGEVVFVGYFLKIMSYNAFETARGAPVLIGRVHTAERRAPPVNNPVDTTLLLLGVLGGGVLVFGFVLWQFRSRKVVRRATAREDGTMVLNSLPWTDLPRDASSSNPLADLASTESSKSP